MKLVSMSVLMYSRRLGGRRDLVLPTLAKVNSHRQELQDVSLVIILMWRCWADGTP